MTDSIFSDRASIKRADDSLQVADLPTWTVARRIIREHLLRRKKLLAISLFAMALSAATTGAIPFMMQQATDELFINRNQALLYTLPILVVLLVALKSAAEYFAEVGKAYIGSRIVADLRVQIFEKLTQADLAWLQRTHSGRFMSSFMNDVSAIREAAGMGLVAIGQNALKITLLIGAMFYMDWRLAVVTLTVLPLVLLMLKRLRKRMHLASKQTFQETGDLTSLFAQTLTGIRVVKAYDREGQETERARQIIDRTVEFLMRSVRTRAASGPMTETLAGIGFALAVFYAGYQGIEGTLTAGHFMGFATAAMLIYPPMKTLAVLQTTLQNGVAAATRVFGIIDLDTKVRERPGARPLQVERGEIVLEDLSFGYRSDEPVLDQLSMTVPAGSRVALVGASGAGKSTVMNLLLRFFNPDSGRILIDGQDIVDCTISSVRLATALVTQEPVLFDDTIRANIMYGSEEASEDEVIAAAKAAAAHDFIMRFPMGYDTLVGEAGGLVSGGQRQRIAFARAMLRNAPILLLDEPTSSLDSEAEAQVQAALDNLLKGRTVIMIAHRLSTVRKADIIHVMDQGRIIESGTHDELVARGGAYARLHRTQFHPSGEAAASPPATRLAKAAGA